MRIPIHGRGTPENPANRFEALAAERDDWSDPDDPLPRTRLLVDHTRSIITRNDSPDVGFETSINPYRGCEHGCSYCYARPGHEYLGFSAGLDFEAKILVKPDAAALLRGELSRPGWKPQTMVMSGVTDPYQPVERRLGITRGCLEVLAEFRNPVAIITKSRLVTRDADLLAGMAEYDAAAVAVSITTLDRKLQQAMEPRAAAPEMRLATIRKLAEQGIPVRVMVAPVIPGLTEHEMPAILEAAAAAGATGAGYIMLRLPLGVADLFIAWLERHVPDRRDKVVSRIRDLRDGRVNDPRYGSRMRGEGPFAHQVSQFFAVSCRRFGLDRDQKPLSVAAFRRPGLPQLEMFAS